MKYILGPGVDDGKLVSQYLAKKKRLKIEK